eukprot:scaffold232127_cov35-Tisochrysis_lutea.AAC.1
MECAPARQHITKRQHHADKTNTPLGMPYGRGHSHPSQGRTASAARHMAGWPSWAQHTTHSQTPTFRMNTHYSGHTEKD